MEKYVKRNLRGYLFNAKYPPSETTQGGRYHGYKSAVEETRFYDFAVLGYDLAFTYKGKRYYFLSDSEYVALSDKHFTKEYQRFSDGNAALEQFCIEGIPIIKLTDKLEDVEPY